MKQDLLGKGLSSNGIQFIFQSMSDFQKFDIVNTAENEGTVEITSEAILARKRDGQTFFVELTLVYREIDGKWEFVTATDNDTLRPNY